VSVFIDIFYYSQPLGKLSELMLATYHT